MTSLRVHLRRLWLRGDRLPPPAADVSQWAIVQTVKAFYEILSLVLVLWLYRHDAPPLLAISGFGLLRTVEAAMVLLGRDPQTADLPANGRFLVAASCYAPITAVILAFAIGAPLIGAPSF